MENGIFSRVLKFFWSNSGDGVHLLGLKLFFASGNVILKNFFLKKKIVAISFSEKAVGQCLALF